MGYAKNHILQCNTQIICIMYNIVIINIIYVKKTMSTNSVEDFVGENNNNKTKNKIVDDIR